MTLSFTIPALQLLPPSRGAILIWPLPQVTSNSPVVKAGWENGKGFELQAQDLLHGFSPGDTVSMHKNPGTEKVPSQAEMCGHETGHSEC